MKIEIELFEYDYFGKPTKSLKIRPTNIDKEVSLEILGEIEKVMIDINLNDLRRALDKIAL